jgi:eukaryotic-like serine/threonine-protein kinase
MRVLTEGTRLADRYTLIRRLGAGGMAEAWLAEDRRAENRVALKFLAAALAADPARRRLFHQEWQAASRLMHAHIVRVFEYHDDPDGPYYAQQFIDGPEIRAVAGQPPIDALRPFGLVADALRYAHAKGLVHRDIKAGNVLLDHRGLPYLIDFGVAAIQGAANAGGVTTIAASPEQRAGASPQAADDVWSLGVLMHEILSGNPPPAAGSGDEAFPTIHAAADGSPVPAEIQSLVRDMLLPDPDGRPSAEQVALRLREAGITAGPARIRSGITPALADTEIEAEALSSIRPLRRDATSRAAPAAGDAPVRGVSPRVAFGGLAILLAVVLTVVFWLPNAIDGERGQTADEPATAQEAAPDTVDDDSTVTDAADQAEGVDPASDAALKSATDESLGDLLSRLERLRYRGIERWGGQTYLNVLEVYEQGDKAYLEKDYKLAGDRYREASRMLEPFFDRVDGVFAETVKAARAAFAAGDHADAVRLYDLAVAITPGNAEAEEGLARARKLSSVLDLVDQALTFENDLDLQAAKLAFEKALELDPAWQPAATGLERVLEAIRQSSFEQRMTEGLEALAVGNYPSARAAFEAARALNPDSQQPVDGLLRVDQEIRLGNIRRLEEQAAAEESNEEWQAAIATYEEIGRIDPDLQFVREGLARARERATIHERLAGFIGDPDSLSAPATMQAATQLLLQVTTMTPTGPRLEDQKNELSRLLKRAATPLTVQLVSDNATEVSIFRVGKLGTFTTQELSLRPGAYVATGSRIGFRDVRLEFRVAPEIEAEPIVIKCEERI